MPSGRSGFGFRNGGASGVAALSPTIWYEAKNVGVAPGASVTTWPATAGPNLTSNGTAPVYQSTYVDFAGLGQLRTSSGTADLGAAGFTLSMVMDVTPVGATAGVMWMWGEEAAGKRRSVYTSGQTDITFSGYSANLSSTADPTPKCVLTVRRTGSTVEMWKDGVSIVSGSPSLVAYVYAGFALGGNYSSSEPWQGRIYEVAGWNSALSDTDRAAVDNDLGIRNGLIGAMSATGGTITTSGLYTIHTFTTSGTFTPAATGTFDVLRVGGGGGGGAGAGGGTGGNGASVNSVAAESVTAGAKTVTIGAGGTSVTGNTTGGTGASTTFNGVTATGGTGGAGAGTGSGGSGAGGAASGAAGGVGVTSSYSGTSTYYGGGGGGAPSGAGGLGGGGAGTNGGTGNAGAANTGGGGSGNYSSGTTGPGGTGVVIIRYLT